MMKQVFHTLSLFIFTAVCSLSAFSQVGEGNEIFSFDFEDPAQVDEWTDLAGFFDIEDGQFLEFEDAGGPLVTLTGDPTLSDIAVSVDATGLAADADWGIVFRATDIDNFYSWQFVNGNLELILYNAGERSSLFSMSYTEELNVVQQFFVAAVGSEIHLFLNGDFIATVEDSTHAAGQVGLFTWVNSGTDLSESLGGTAFDNFVVSEVNLDVAAVTRSFDATSFLPGQAINVTLDLVTLSANSVDVSVVETVPEALTIGNISDGGTANGNVITWDISFTDSASISYTATVPATFNPSASGYEAVWSGINGEFNVQGDSSLFMITFESGDEIISYDFEDASQLDAWTDLAGFFDIEAGQLMELEDAGGPLVTLVEGSYSDLAVSVDATGLVADADWGLVFRATDIDNFYSWQFVNGGLALLEYVEGTRTTLYSETFAEELNVAQKYLVVAQGQVIQVWLDGEIKAIVEDDSLTEGQVGFFTWVNDGTDLSESIGGTAFDNLVISTVANVAEVNNWSLY